MKHAASAAAIALALGFGLATAAQAHGTYHQSAMPQTSMRGAQAEPMQSRHIAPRRAGLRVKQAQERLKAEGFYKGRIDGILGPRTRRAIALFQRKNGLRQTATLDRATRDRLTGSRAVGVGSSMPNRPGTNNGNANLGATGQGVQPSPMTRPAPPNENGRGAGGPAGNPDTTK
jgi:peptidoglycan hydrolase-like protein with peptidoglycan-binding domain